MNLINKDDHVIIFLNEKPVHYGIAGTIRGFLQDKIQINIFDARSHNWFEANRQTGESPDGYIAVVVPQEKWQQVATAIKAASKAQYDFEQEQLRKDRELVAIEAEKWFETLGENEQKMVHALVWKRQPIAYA